MAIIALIYTGLLLQALVPTAFNPLALARVSREFPGERFWDQSPPFEAGVGYDGQFFYYIAREPWPRGDDLSYLDQPAYRYERILLPALAHALAFGRPELIGWTLLLVNLLGLAGGCYFAARIIAFYGGSPWWLLAYALNPGLIMGVQMDLAEPLALGLTTAAIWLYLRRRPLLAAVTLSFAALARETTILVAAALLAWELLAMRSWRRAAIFLLPMCTAGGWLLVVWLRMGTSGSSLGWGQVGLPLTAAGLRLQWAFYQIGDAATTEADLLTPAADALVLIGLVALAVIALTGFWRRGPFDWQLGLQGALLLTLSWAVWGVPLNAARAATLLFFFHLLTVLEHRAEARPVLEPGITASVQRGS